MKNYIWVIKIEICDLFNELFQREFQQNVFEQNLQVL